MSPVITFPFSCLDCKAVSRFSTREIESASRIRCTACGSISLERNPITQDQILIELTAVQKKKRARRSKTTPEQRLNLLSQPTRYRRAVLKGEYQNYLKRKQKAMNEASRSSSAQGNPFNLK